MSQKIPVVYESLESSGRPLTHLEPDKYAAKRAAVREEYTMELAASKRPGPSIEKALLPGTTAIDFDKPASKSDVVGSWITKDSGERASFESGMVRDVTTGKTLWHKVFDGPLLRRWAELLTRGAEKYPDEEAGLPNWMLADGNTEWVRFRESAFRHFMQWYNGDSDEDHAAAVCFNLNGAEYVQDKLDRKDTTD